MRYLIDSDGAGLSVRIDDVPGRKQSILEGIDRCRQSAWACPSGECMNVEAIEGRCAGGSVFLVFSAKPGMQLSAVGVEQCLGYLLAQAAKA